MRRRARAVDFDGTLSLLDGLDVETGVGALFGDDRRQQQLAILLTALLRVHRCWVLTANRGYEHITGRLNELLLAHHAAVCEMDDDDAGDGADEAAAGGGDGGGRARSAALFVAHDTVRYVEAGSKIKAIQKIVSVRGYALVTAFR